MDLVYGTKINLKEVLIVKATPDSKYVDGYVNRPLLITDGYNTNVLASGEQDTLVMTTTADKIYVFGYNTNLRYVTMAVFNQKLEYTHIVYIGGDDIDHFAFGDLMDSCNFNAIREQLEDDITLYFPATAENTPMNARIVNM